MTFKEALGDDTELRQRLDQLLASEDAVVILADRRGITTYAHGFGVSGCQLELLGHDVDAAIRLVGGGASAHAAPECAE